MTTILCLPPTYRRTMIAGIATALVGCANVVDIAERHGDANLVQERVMNQQLLLNVVRAAHRQPLHFSRIPYIKLPLASSSPWEFTFPFGDVGAYTRNSAKTSVGGGLITIEVSPQDSQEFIQGITTPVRLNLMNLYLQQGWPKQLVLYVFVEEIRLLKRQGKSSEIALRVRNDPEEPEELKRFSAAIDEITKCDLTVVPDEPRRGPNLPATWTGPLSGIADAMQAGVVGLFDEPGETAKDGPRKVMALQFAPDARFKLIPRNTASNGHDCLPDANPDLARAVDAGRQAAASAEARNAALLAVMRNQGAVERKSAPATTVRTEQDPTTYSVELVMRSPDSMVYYLGEVMRSNGNVTVKRDRDHSRATLFKVASGEVRLGIPPDRTAIWIDYWDRRYSIPQQGLGPDVQDRSMQTLGLVGQILQLQNKASAPPRAASVRVEP